MTHPLVQNDKHLRMLLSRQKEKILKILALAKCEFMDYPLDGLPILTLYTIIKYGGKIENWRSTIIPLIDDCIAKMKKYKFRKPDKYNHYLEGYSKLLPSSLLGAIEGFVLECTIEAPEALKTFAKINTFIDPEEIS